MPSKALADYKAMFSGEAPADDLGVSPKLAKRLRLGMLSDRWKAEKGRDLTQGERSFIENEGEGLGPEDLRQHSDLMEWLGVQNGDIDKALEQAGAYKLEKTPEGAKDWGIPKMAFEEAKRVGGGIIAPAKQILRGKPIEAVKEAVLTPLATLTGGMVGGDERDLIAPTRKALLKGFTVGKEAVIGGALDLSAKTAGKAALQELFKGGEEQQKRLDDTFESLGWQKKVPVLGRTSKIAGFFADPLNLPIGGLSGKLAKSLGLVSKVSKTGIESKLAEDIGNGIAKTFGTKEEQIAAALGDKDAGRRMYDTIVAGEVERAAAESNWSKDVSKAFSNTDFWDKLGKIPLIGENGRAAIARAVRGIPVIGEKFGVGRSGQPKVFRAAEGIKEFDAAGNPVFGAETRTGSGIERVPTAEAQKLWGEMTPAEQRATRWWSQQRELDKAAFTVNSNIEGYIHHFWDDGGLYGAVRRFMLKKKTPPSLMERAQQEATGFTPHAERAILKGGGQARGEMIANQIKEDVAKIAAKPIPPTGIPNGWVEVPVLQSTRTGQKIGQIAGGKMMPKSIYDDMVRHEEALKDVDGLTGIANALGSYYKSNILTAPGTTVTNALSGGFQYLGKVMESFGKAVFTGEAKPLLNDIWAPVEALYNAGKRPAHLWGRKSGLGADIAKEGGVVNKAFGIALAPFEAVENFWKRALVNSELGAKGMRGLSPDLIVQNKQLVADLNRVVDKYAFDYSNIPSGLDKIKKSWWGWMVAPFPTYGYKLARYYSRYGAALNPFIQMPLADRAARILTLGTLGSAGYMNAVPEERKHIEGMTSQSDVTGRTMVGKTPEGKERWLRTVKYPWMNLGQGARGIQDLIEGEGDEGIQNGMAEFMSAGPLVEGIKLAFNWKNRWDAYIPEGVRKANMVKGFIPGVRLTEGIKATQGGERVLPDTFMDTILNAMPFTGMRGHVQIDRVTKQKVLLDPNLEAKKFWIGLSMKDLDPERYSIERQRRLKAALVAINDADNESKLNEAIDKLEKVDLAKAKELKSRIESKRIILRGDEGAAIEKALLREIQEKAKRGMK